MPELNRREFLRHEAEFSATLGFLSFYSRLAAGSSYRVEFPDMLLSYLSGKLNELAVKWDQQRASIRTSADLNVRNRYVRQKYLEMLGELPQKSPLHPKVARILNRKGYRVENVMFESRPDFWVTGNLYVPETGPGPFPAIISPCGHYPLARMKADYQFAYLNLVKSGFVVLAYDPIGQGERRHYWNPQTGETESDLGPVYEHSVPGQLLLLLGENLTNYFVWDGIRAVDYLESRPEVDKNRIGCAGHSGGGMVTLFITPMEERIKCAAVHEGSVFMEVHVETGTTRIRSESRVGPADVEQYLFPAALHGVDRTDLQIAIAPRPLLSSIEDYNPRFNQATERIRARYRLLGVPEKFATEQATDPHAWTVKLRLATTDWFCRWFYDRKGPTREPDFEPEAPENLYCTPNGSLRYSRHGDNIFSLILKRQAERSPELKPPSNAQELRAFRTGLADRIRQLIGFTYAKQPLSVRHLVQTPRKGYSIEKVEFLSEPGIYVPAWVFLPESPRAALPTLLFVSEFGKQADGMELGLLEKLVCEGHLIVAVDVRGIGETQPAHSPAGDGGGTYAHFFSVETAMSYMAWFMDRSLFGMRVQDVVRSVDYVESRTDANCQNFCVIGKGMGALWVLYAAALDRRIKMIICDGGLLSYRSLAQADRYLHGANVFIRDVLKHFDLPHVASAICDRRLVLLSLLDPMKRSVDAETAYKVYKWTADTYANMGVANRFQLLPYTPALDPARDYLHALRAS